MREVERLQGDREMGLVFKKFEGRLLFSFFSFSNIKPSPNVAESSERDSAREGVFDGELEEEEENKELRNSSKDASSSACFTSQLPAASPNVTGSSREKPVREGGGWELEKRDSLKESPEVKNSSREDLVKGLRKKFLGELGFDVILSFCTFC